jgi:lysozyme family protein
MARFGVSKNKKSPRATELSQLKKELQRVTEQLESRDRELEQRSAELREALEHRRQRPRYSASSAARPWCLVGSISVRFAKVSRRYGALPLQSTR